jgi:uncharacterized protein
VLSTERVCIPGGAGRLDGELCYPEGGEVTYIALMLNPHPHMGGSMRNKLIERLTADLAGGGDRPDNSVAPTAATFRFDYRGVGASEGAAADVIASMAQFWRTGHAPEDEGMHDDAAATLAWIREQFPDLPLLLVGYSFGAAAACRLLPSRKVDGAILIAPTLCQHDFSAASRSTAPPLLVVYSDNDFATPREALETWLETIDASRCCVPGGDHFFRGREREVSRACEEFARRVLTGAVTI